MIDTSTITGIKVELHRSDDDRCHCGATMASIGSPAGPHAAALRCITCGRNRGWLSEDDATKLIETVRVFGVPTEVITIHKASPQFASAASSGANAVVSSRPQGTENMSENDFGDIYGSKYLSAADLNGEQPRCKISHVEGPKEMKNPDGTIKKRLILNFSSGVAKQLVLNQTNALDLKKWFGTRDACGGREVELFTVPTSMGDGIRMREVKPAAKPAAAKQANPDPDLDDLPF